MRTDMIESVDVTSEMVRDFVTTAIPDDERLWVPQAKNVWFRPLLLDRVSGMWVNLLRVRKSGVVSRHCHPAPVHGYVIKGSWRYLEHNWVARAGMYVFEPPGEVHTLVVDDSMEEMITFFHVSGALIYYDEKGAPSGHDDVHTKIAMCKRHFTEVGLGADFVQQFVR
jgi:quercetin dioxygenase-like cupin family protein